MQFAKIVHRDSIVRKVLQSLFSVLQVIGVQAAVRLAPPISAHQGSTEVL